MVWQDEALGSMSSQAQYVDSTGISRCTRNAVLERHLPLKFQSRQRRDWDWSCEFATITSCHDGVAIIEDERHPATMHLARASDASPPRWDVYDEFYGFATNPRGTVRLVARS